jgi:hypothetical protein
MEWSWEMTNLFEEQLAAGMRERVAGIAITTDIDQLRRRGARPLRKRLEPTRAVHDVTAVSRTRRRTEAMRTRVLVGCLLPLALASLAACASPGAGKGVASVASGSARPSATPSLSQLAQAIRHARCMRDHGVPMPDPVERNGRIDTPVDKHEYMKGISWDTFDRAKAACKQYEPVLPPDVQALKLAGARAEARCMRAHGVESFPDPDPNDLGRQLPDSVFDDPQFPEANDACRTRRPSSSPIR